MSDELEPLHRPDLAEILDLPIVMPGDNVQPTSKFGAYYTPDGTRMIWELGGSDDSGSMAMAMAVYKQYGPLTDHHYQTTLTIKQHLIWMSTVYLGVNHNWMGSYPMVWETMIQGDGHWSDFQTRYCTERAAVNGHLTAARYLVSIGMKVTETNIEIPALES